MTTPERVAEVARSWIGTPFYPHAAKKGVGADCVQLALEIYIEAGVLPAGTTLPKYSLDAGDHRDESMVIQWLSASPDFEPESEHPTLGSLITLNVGRVVHHVGIMTGATLFVQSIRRYGVVERDLRDSTWSSRLRGSWKPKALCPSSSGAQKT